MVLGKKKIISSYFCSRDSISSETKALVIKRVRTTKQETPVREREERREGAFFMAA